jgi:hypothetical protein
MKTSILVQLGPISFMKLSCPMEHHFEPLLLWGERELVHPDFLGNIDTYISQGWHPMKLQCFRFFWRLHNECMCSLYFLSSIVLNFLLYNLKIFNLYSLCVNFHPLFHIPFRNQSLWNLNFPKLLVLYNLSY